MENSTKLMVWRAMLWNKLLKWACVLRGLEASSSRTIRFRGRAKMLLWYLKNSDLQSGRWTKCFTLSEWSIRYLVLSWFVLSYRVLSCFIVSCLVDKDFSHEIELSEFYDYFNLSSTPFADRVFLILDTGPFTRSPHLSDADFIVWMHVY